MPRSLTPEHVELVRTDLEEAKIIADVDVHLIQQRVNDVFNLVARECAYQSIQAPGDLTLGMAIEGKNGGSPASDVAFH